MSKYLGLFVSEAGEHLSSLGDELVRLEKAGASPRGPVVDSMFRHAHSVKGMAASMGQEGIASLAHKVEDLVDQMRRRPEEIAGEAVDVVFDAVDSMTAMVQRAAAGESPLADAALLERLATVIAAWRSPGGDSPPPKKPEGGPPPAEPPPKKPPAKAEHRRLEIEVEIAGSCPVPGVRGFLVVKKLSGLGNVTQTTPSVEELKAGRIPGKRLVALLDTAEPSLAVERALSQISDLSKVSVRDAAPRSEAAEKPAAPPPAAPAPPLPEPPPLVAIPEGTRTVRVKTELLDYFLDTVGELILATARLREVGKALPEPNRPMLDDGVDRLHAIVKDLHDKVMAVRMTPLALVTDRLPRAARDLARKVQKQVDVEVKGAEIELDRAILEELGDPLLHVLRNCIDHGIEPAHLRQLAGKPAAGKVSVFARRERDRVLLEISDDGRGMDAEKLKASAVRRGAITLEQAVLLTEREALQLACLPGVSTAEAVTDLSGRGVGMDAVKRSVELVGGALEIDSTPGQGTKLTFRLPLTVAVQPVLLVRVGDEVLGLPISKVLGAAEVDPATLTTSRGAPLLPYDGGLVPVHDLGRLLGLPGAEGGAAKGARSVVVVEGEGGRLALVTDALLGQEEAVLKPLARPLDLVPGLSAVTVLGNGRPVFILDVPRLLAA